MRSKTLLVSNILASVYSAFLLFIFGSAIIQAGGTDYIYAVGKYFKTVFELLEFMGQDSGLLMFLYVVVVLLCIHIIFFVLGCLVGWLSYIGKKSGGAKFAAVLYLLGSICFPIYLCFGLPITIVGFVGGSKQKKMNNQQKEI